MGKIKGMAPYLLLCFCVLLICSTLSAADGLYKITGTILFTANGVSTVVGKVTDSSGNPVSTAEVTITCGSISIKEKTLPTGAYVAKPPACPTNYVYTVTVPGLAPVTKTGGSGAPDQVIQQDLTLVPEVSLGDVVSTLKILSRATPSAIPTDRNQDKKIGLAEAVYTLQAIKGLRGTVRIRAPQQLVRLSAAGAKNVKIDKDNDGDGVYEENVTQVTTDENGYLDVAGLANGTYALTATGNDGNGAVRVENIKIAGRSVHIKTLQLKPVGSISGNVQLEGQTDHSDINVMVPGTSFGAYTDDTGNFTIHGVPEGTYNLRASKSGFGTITMPDLPVEQDKDSEVETFSLTSVVGEVTGIVWLQGLIDYTGILVSLRKDAGTTYLTTTNAAGEYLFQDVATGEYNMSVGYAGYISVQKTFKVTAGTNAQADVNLKINSEKGTLSGTITLDNFNEHSGILVSLAGTGYMAITDATGSYSISGIPNGTYTVFVKAEGYATQRLEGIQILTGQTTEQNATLAARTGTNYGSIVGMALYLDRTDHSGISIKVEGTDIPLAGTDTNGGFIIANVPTGTYTLLFNQDNYKNVSRVGVLVVPWEATFVKTVQLIPPVGNITGKVQLEVEGDTSHDNVTVSVDGTSISAQSLADGSFVLENVKEGLVSITAYKAGFVTAHVTGINVLAGQTVNLENPVLLNKPPEPPTGLTALQASGSGVMVEWTSSLSKDVVGYHVYYSERSDLINLRANSDLVSVPVSGKWQFTVNDLKKGGRYYFAVRAVDATQLESDPSQYALQEVLPLCSYSEVCEISYDGAFNYPRDIAISRDNLRAYVTNRNLASVSVVDLVTGQVIAYYLVGSAPADVMANPLRNEVYVVTEDGFVQILNSSEAIDPENPPQLIPSESIAGLTNAKRVIVSPDGNYLFVSQNGPDNNRILVFDLNTRTNVLGEGQGIAVGGDPLGMVVANKELFVANSGSNTISVIEIDTASATKWEIKGTIAGMSGPVDLAASSDGKYVYVANPDANTGIDPDEVAVIDTSTHSVIKRIAVGVTPLRMATGAGILYVANYMDNSVS